jgi:5-guanidino-2-oxopentanoate decarboxylase
VLSKTTALAAARFPTAASLPQVPAGQTDAAARLLAESTRPVIVAGGGARGAAGELRQLAETLNSPVAMTAAGKGLLPENHPLNLGTSLHHAPIQNLISGADVVLAVGTEFSETDLFYAMKLALRGRLIRIDIDPLKLADHYAAEVPLWGDARSTLAAIQETLARRAKGHAPRTPADTAALRGEIERSYDAKARAQLGALKAIRSALPSDGAVFTDMTQIAYFGNYAFPVDLPRLWFHPSGFGTLGFALPAAIGAKISSPTRAVLALAGDFGLQFTLGELMTAVEAGLSLPVVVWNNSALGQIRDDMIAAGIPPTDVVARNPDFVALARACGAHGLQVKDARTLAEAVRSALGAKGPTLIEAVAAAF